MNGGDIREGRMHNNRVARIGFGHNRNDYYNHIQTRFETDTNNDDIYNYRQNGAGQRNEGYANNAFTEETRFREGRNVSNSVNHRHPSKGILNEFV